MPGFTSDPVCPKCGGAMNLEDKNTFTGQEIREYRCESCRHLEIEYGGPALWQVLHDANVAKAEADRIRAKKAWWKFWKK